MKNPVALPKAAFLAVVCAILLAAVVPANAATHLPNCKADAGCLLFDNVKLQKKWKSVTVADVQAMIDDGADVNAKNKFGNTPVHLATLFGNIAVIPILVKAGADVNAKGHEGDTPLHMAVRNRQYEVIPILVKAGAYINATNDNGWTPLYWAVHKGQAKVIPILVKMGANVHAKDNDGDTPLHWAAKGRYVTVISTLIQVGADVHAKDNDGMTPLHLAVFHGKAEVVPVLIQVGADVNAKTNSGNTPFHAAAYNGNAEVIPVLVKEGAYINATDNDGNTPLDLARNQKHWNVVKYLESVSASASTNCFNIIRGKPNQIVRVNGVAMTMLVDTGAGITHLTNQQARAARIQTTGENEFILADGSIVVNKIGSASISMGGGMTGNFPVSIGDGKGLLGRDVLDEFACR